MGELEVFTFKAATGEMGDDAFFPQLRRAAARKARHISLGFIICSGNMDQTYIKRENEKTNKQKKRPTSVKMRALYEAKLDFFTEPC
jgi:hypothetical protein